MRFKEIETKYSADEIDIKKFIDLIEPMKPDKKMMVSSYDDYFVNKDGDFVRYRYTDNHGELTIKKKTTHLNNNERMEINVPTAGDNLPTVSAFLEFLGYQHNFGIYKTCKIYWVDNVVVVYYVVYDKDLKEQRRFIEVEADESFDWPSEAAAWDQVVKWEKLLEPLDISPKNRLKKSLFEMFRKEV